jgi:2'-5' RNA ligase
MLCESGEHDLINLFALVTYIPDPLGHFLDDLRKELVPGFAPHAHVTILPPRPLSGTPQAAIEAVRARIHDFAPFEIEAAHVEVFSKTDVVYLSLGQGGQEMLQMHEAMNVGPLSYDEPHPYHPHITLAQDLTHQQQIELTALARRRWSEYPYQRMFPVESMAFVQSSAKKLWFDLARFELDHVPSVHR